MAITNNGLLTGAILLTDTSAAATAVVAKASSAVLYEIELDNTANAAATYLKLFNTGTVTVGTTVPDMVVMVPASVSRTVVVPTGITFATALAYCAVTAGGTAGTTAPSSAFAIKMGYV